MISKGSGHTWHPNLIDVSCNPPFVRRVAPLDETEKFNSTSVLDQLTHAALQDIRFRYMTGLDAADLKIRRGVQVKPCIIHGPSLKFNILRAQANKDNFAVVLYGDCEVESTFNTWVYR